MPVRGFARQALQAQRGSVASNPIYELGGLVEEENSVAVRPTDLIAALNCARKGKMTGTRPGLTLSDPLYDDAIGSGLDYVQGVYEYRQADDSRELLTVVDGNVYRAHDGTAMTKSAGVTISSGQNYLWTFADFQDKVFMAGGNAGDTFNYWDGSGSPGAWDDVALGIDCKYVFSKWNMLFLNGFNGTAYYDNPMVSRFCDFGTDATNPVNWPNDNVIPGQLLGQNFGPGSWGSERTTGFGSYQNGASDLLLVLTNKRLVAFAPNPAVTSSADAFVIADTVDTGCVHQNAFVNLGSSVGDAVFVSQDGIHSVAQSKEFGGKVTEYLSWPIRRTFDTINRTRMKYCSGAYWQNEGLVTFLFSTGSSLTHDLILCMDIKGASRISPDTVRWYKWELGAGFVPNIMVPARGSDDKPYIYVGGTDGTEAYLGRFNRTTYSDLGEAYRTTIQTKNEDYGIPNQSKIVGDTHLSVQGGGNHQVKHTYVLDDGETLGLSTLLTVPPGGGVWGTGTWGSGVWGTTLSTERQRIYGVGDSPTIGHLFDHTGANQPYWIGSLVQEVFISSSTRDAQANTVTT